MTALSWLAWGLVVVAVVVVAWGEVSDRRARSEERADLDELAGDYHTPAERIAALERDIAALIAHVTSNEQPSEGRHTRKAAA